MEAKSLQVKQKKLDHCKCGREACFLWPLSYVVIGFGLMLAASPMPAQGVPPPSGDSSHHGVSEELTKVLQSVRQEVALRATALERARKLYEQGVVARKEVEEEQRKLEEATTRGNRLQAQLDKLSNATPPKPEAPLVTQPAPPLPEDNDLARLQAQGRKLDEEIKQLAEELSRRQQEIDEQMKAIEQVRGELDGIIASLNQLKTKLAVRQSSGSLDFGPHPFMLAAREYLGVPYLWGGLTSRGLDCSGLIYRVLGRFGYRVPHSAAALARLGKPVLLTDLRQGDLVFFQNTYKPGVSHVGLYLGGSRFLHASSGRGLVTIGNLLDPYYVAHFAGARRLLVQSTADRRTGPSGRRPAARSARRR